MADTQKKYFSVFNNGTEDFEVKDAEARADILQLQNEVAQLDPSSAHAVEPTSTATDLWDDFDYDN